MANLVIDVPPELEHRLREEAAKRGVAAPEYARTLLAERLLPPDTIDAEPEPVTREERAQRVRSARGAFAHVPFSSEDRAREKQEEIDLEEQRWKERV